MIGQKSLHIVRWTTTYQWFISKLPCWIKLTCLGPLTSVSGAIYLNLDLDACFCTVHYDAVVKGLMTKKPPLELYWRFWEQVARN